MMVDVLRHAALRVICFSGWRLYAICFVLGASAALAFAPTYLIVLAFLGFTLFYLILEKAATRRRAFAVSWWFGLGHFMAGLYWVSISFMVDAEQYAWVMPFAVFGLTGVLAIYIGIVGLAFFYLKQPGWRGVMVFSTLYVLLEFARSHLFTGFPWNLTGYMWTFSDGVSQIASVVGVYGMSWFSLLLFAMPSLLIRKRHPKPLYIITLLCLAMYTGGLLRLQTMDNDYVPDVKLRLVQASIEQKVRWDPEFQMGALRKHIELSTQNRPQDITHVIWSETSMPFAITPYSRWTDMLANAAPVGGGLITGYIRNEPVPGQRYGKSWNSIIMVGSDHALSKPYDKAKLVPFGEYMPLSDILPEQVLPGPTGFSKGEGHETLSWKGLPEVGPLVCYEAIFPEMTVNPDNRPDWLLNVTNDAWFGRSSGPYQHLNMVRMRAVEQGLPLIRVANSGISAVIDPYGRVLDSLGIGKVGVIDSYLPKKISSPTIYSRINDYILMFMMLTITLVMVFSKKFNI